jgi:hypothetical protein
MASDTNNKKTLFRIPMRFSSDVFYARLLPPAAVSLVPKLETFSGRNENEVRRTCSLYSRF